MNDAPTSGSILATLDAHAESVTAIARASRTRDEGARIAAITRLLTELVTDLPLVGPLATEAAKAVFARSAYAEVEAALTVLAAEQDAEAERKATAEAVAHVLAPALALIIGATKRLQQDLAGLDEAMSANRAARVTTYVKRLAGGTVVEVTGTLTNDVDIDIDDMSGGTAIKL